MGAVWADTANNTCGATGNESSVTWSLENGTLTISGSGVMADYYWSSDQPWHDSRNDIQSVVIGNGITRIGDNAFITCVNLQSVTIPQGVISIGQQAVADTKLTGVSIPASVTSLDSLSLSAANNMPFDGISTLASYTVVADNPNYAAVDGVLFNKDKTALLKYPAAKTGTSYTIPEGVTTIYPQAFYEATKLQSIHIPKSVTTIGGHLP